MWRPPVTPLREVRLRSAEEVNDRLGVPDRFLLIEGEEITDSLPFPLGHTHDVYDRFHVHLNATNLDEPIAPRGGVTVTDVIQRNVDALHEQRDRTGKPMIRASGSLSLIRSTGRISRLAASFMRVMTEH